jgi:hypothetical protein
LNQLRKVTAGAFTRISTKGYGVKKSFPSNQEPVGCVSCGREPIPASKALVDFKFMPLATSTRDLHCGLEAWCG